MNKDDYIQEELVAGEEQEEVSLAGYQVAKAEFFAHTREPAVTVWDTGAEVVVVYQRYFICLFKDIVISCNFTWQPFHCLVWAGNSAF